MKVRDVLNYPHGRSKTKLFKKFKNSVSKSNIENLCQIFKNYSLFLIFIVKSKCSVLLRSVLNGFKLHQLAGKYCGSPVPNGLKITARPHLTAVRVLLFLSLFCCIGALSY